MRVICGVCQLVTVSDRVPEANSLIHGRSHEQLCFLEIAKFDHRLVMSDKSSVITHIPGCFHAVELNHVTLEIPHKNFALHVIIVVARSVWLISRLGVLLGNWSGCIIGVSWINFGCCGLKVGLVVFFGWHKAIAVRNVANWGGFLVFVAL